MAAIPDPTLPAKKNALSLTEVQEHTGAYRNYTNLIEKLDMIFSDITARSQVDIADIDVIGAGVLKAVQEERDSSIGYILGGEVQGHELAKSSVNSAILAALTAQELKFSRSRRLKGLLRLFPPFPLPLMVRSSLGCIEKFITQYLGYPLNRSVKIIFVVYLFTQLFQLYGTHLSFSSYHTHSVKADTRCRTEAPGLTKTTSKRIVISLYFRLMARKYLAVSMMR
ncbi:hypothetical protein FACS1894163_07300 [Spirochaetia bacterium]|nr:hypothetical protein FACS1894163_07300 [Spirochaetia bacterium]